MNEKGKQLDDGTEGGGLRRRGRRRGKIEKDEGRGGKYMCVCGILSDTK